MSKEVNVIYIDEIKSWVHRTSGPDAYGNCTGFVVSKVMNMSIEEQKDFFLDKILVNDEKVEIYKAILMRLTKK